MYTKRFHHSELYEYLSFVLFEHSLIQNHGGMLVSVSGAYCPELKIELETVYKSYDKHLSVLYSYWTLYNLIPRYKRLLYKYKVINCEYIEMNYFLDYYNQGNISIIWQSIK